MIGSDTFAGTFGGGRQEDIVKIAKMAVRHGYAIVPVEPMGKVPMCTLTVRQAHTADLEAQALGLRKHECGINHAITDDATAGRVFTRLSKERPGLNIGLEAGRSGMVLADADNLESVEAWSAVWYEHIEADPDLVKEAPHPTVLTPGRKLADGTWAHKDGAHFWYRLTEDQLAELPKDGPGSMQLPGGVSLSWRDRQALVPPSVREEGPYRLVGKVEDCPEWLFEMIYAYVVEQIEARASKQAKVAAGGPDDIEAWSAATPWAELLEAAGWSPSFVYDSCGPACHIWTRPGEAGSAKSATAHEPGCTVTDTSTGWGPLHIWSDIAADELGARHLSKLQFLARTQYAGDTRQAMTDHGLRSNVVSPDEAVLEADLEAWWLDPRRSRESADDDQEPSPVASGVSTPGSGSDDAGKARELVGRIDLAAFLAGDEQGGPTPTILHRGDGNAMIYPGTINQLIGEAEGGKTWVALAAVTETLVAGGRAAYVDIDGNGVAAIAGRLTQLGADLAEAVSEDRFALFTPTDPEQYRRMVTLLAASHSDLVVVDSFGEAMPIFGLSTNDNDEVTRFMREQLTPLAEAGSAVLVIDHVVKNPEQRGGHGIGAQAKKRRTDGAYIEVVVADVFSKRTGGRAKLYVRKDRHSGLNNVSGRDRYWGSFVISPDGGYRIEGAAVEPAGSPADERDANLQRQMAAISGYLHGLLQLAVGAGELDPAAASARSVTQLREASVGVRAQDVPSVLRALLEVGAVGRTLVNRSERWHSIAQWTDLEAEVEQEILRSEPGESGT